MNRKEHSIMISTFVAVAIIFMFSLYMDVPSGNITASGEEFDYINCVRQDNFRVCDVQYPDSSIKEEGYREEVLFED